MACLSSSNRACARVVQEKLCQLVAGSKSQLGHQQQQVQLLHGPGPVASSVVNGVGGGGGGGGGGDGGGGGGIGASLPKVGTAGKRTFLLSSGCAYPLYSVGPAGSGTPLVAAVAHSVGGSIGIARNFYTGRGNFIQPSSVALGSARSAGVPADALLFERNQVSENNTRVTGEWGNRSSAPIVGRGLLFLVDSARFANYEV
uniref:Uncharacterized protein n=1 Tax=Anopheles maculatus TaxID=74869 RepID=A0A182T6Z2_9DIPT